ncbi:Tn3 family transposase [Mesorhizobium sp. M1182]
MRSQAFRASSLNLVVSAIVHWDPVYIERAVTHLGKMHREVPDHLLKRVSPLSWEHINVTGIYTSTVGMQIIRCQKASGRSDFRLGSATPHEVHAPFDLIVSLGTILVPTLEKPAARICAC